jgi:hypothetical protein
MCGFDGFGSTIVCGCFDGFACGCFDGFAYSCCFDGFACGCCFDGFACYCCFDGFVCSCYFDGFVCGFNNSSVCGFDGTAAVRAFDSFDSSDSTVVRVAPLYVALTTAADSTALCRFDGFDGAAVCGFDKRGFDGCPPRGECLVVV